MGLAAPPTMATSAVVSLCNRLSTLADVDQKLPWSLRSKQEGATQSEKQAHLKGLLERDAGLFLERYGGSLESEELAKFDVLRGDYEVNWHLDRLADDRSHTPQHEKARAALMKNRRLAYLQRLEDEGAYFSEDAMRERAPLLHEQFLGTDAATASTSGRQLVVPRPGEGLSEVIMRQAKEDFIAARLKAEREDFAKQADELGTEDGAGPRAAENSQEEMEEDSAGPELISEAPSDQKLESAGRLSPIASPGKVSGVHRKAGKVRFGVISGASVAATRHVTSAEQSSEPAVAPQLPTETATPQATADVHPHARRAFLDDDREAVSGMEGTAKDGIPAEARSQQLEGRQPQAGTFNEASPSGRTSMGEGQNLTASGQGKKEPILQNAGANKLSSVNGDKEEVSHARFGDFPTPEPISTSAMASQIVRTVLESAGAGPRGSRTRFGEISDRGFVRFGEQQSGVSTKQPSKDGPKRSEGAASGFQKGEALRETEDEFIEEMDTDEEDLGSRTHTDTSELGDDSVDVDSGRKAQVDDFRRVMRERFLEGKDAEHVDYRSIDNDVRLDDDWLGQVDRDAQEKYFDDD